MRWRSGELKRCVRAGRTTLRVGLIACLGMLAVAVVSAEATGASISATESQQFSGQVATLTTSQCVTSPITAGPTGTINWGDGQSSAAAYTFVNGTAPHQYTVSGTHTYAEEGSYAATVNSTYTCGTTYTASSSFTAQVADGHLSASGASLSATAGQQFSGPVASFTDADPKGTAGDYTATIDWGDGTPTSAGTVIASGSGFSVAGAHTYRTAGSYGTTVTITDVGGSSAAGHGSANVVVSGGSGGSGGPGGPQARSSFVVGFTGAGQAIFNASGSAPAGSQVLRYGWSLTGGGQPDVVCPGSDPNLTVYTRHALTHVVTLTVVDSHGAVTVSQHLVQIPAPPKGRLPSGLPHGSSRFGPVRHPSFSLLGDCQGTPLPLAHGFHPEGGVQPGPGGSPPPACDGQDVVFGAVDAKGCLYPVTDVLKEIPRADYRTIADLLCAKNAYFCVPSLNGPSSSGVPHFGAARIATAKACTSCGALAEVEAMMHNYISYSPVRINGLDFDPQNGAPIILIPGADLVVSSDARVLMDGFPVNASHAFALYLPDAGGFLGTFPGASHIPIIGSLPFVGDIGVNILKAGAKLGNGDTCQFDCSAVTVHVALPPLFTDFSNHLLTADGVITADNPDGLHLDSLEVQVPHADFAGVGVQDVDFSYHRQTDAFHGAATLELAIISVGGSIDFVHGKFKGASALVDGLDIPLGEGIFLNELDASFSLNPTTLGGGASVTGGPEILGESLIKIHAGLVLQIQPFSLDISGQASILRPAGG